MHVSAALPYVGGLPPSIFKRSIVLIPGMRDTILVFVKLKLRKLKSLNQFTTAKVWNHRTIIAMRGRKEPAKRAIRSQRLLRHFLSRVLSGSSYPANFSKGPHTRAGTCVCGQAVPDCVSVPGMTSTGMHGAFRMPRWRTDTADARGCADCWRSPWNEW